MLISGVVFAPSASFAQSERNNNALESFFDIFRQIFSFDARDSESVTEFNQAVVIQTSGTSSTTDTEENNVAPIADAGEDQMAFESETVTLDGSSSTDVDGTIESYEWTQDLGPIVELSSKFEVMPTFEAPEVSEDTVIEFSLKVTDDQDESSTDKVQITIKNVNVSPTANAGPDQTVMEFATVKLDGSSSTDSDGTIVSYLWSQQSGITIELSSLSDVMPTFEAPDVSSQSVSRHLLQPL